LRIGAAAVGIRDERSREREQRDEHEEQDRPKLRRAICSPTGGDSDTGSSKRKAPPTRGLALAVTISVPDGAAVCIRDERGREREQSDREHDERAVHASDLAHRSLLSGFVCAPVTLDPPANRSLTSG
jgi:hypothetical protein